MGKRWSTPEEHMLGALYQVRPPLSAEEMAQKINMVYHRSSPVPVRTPLAIEQKANEIGLSHNPHWTDADDRRLLDLVTRHPRQRPTVKQLAELFNRKPHGIYRRLHILGIYLKELDQ